MTDNDGVGIYSVRFHMFAFHGNDVFLLRDERVKPLSCSELGHAWCYVLLCSWRVLHLSDAYSYCQLPGTYSASRLTPLRSFNEHCILVLRSVWCAWPQHSSESSIRLLQCFLWVSCIL